MTIKTSAIGKKTVRFTHKTTFISSIKRVTPAQKPTPIVATTVIQDDVEVVIPTEDDEITLTGDEIGNVFQDTSPEGTF